MQGIQAENDDPEVLEEGAEPPFTIYSGNREDLDDSAALGGLSLALNKTYGLLTCLRQGCGHVLTKKWTSHVSHHTGKPVEAEHATAIEELLRQHPRQVIPRTPDMAPIQGLALCSGYVCQACLPNEPFMSATKDGLAHHHYQCHRGQELRRQQCHFQRLTKGGEDKKHFLVSPLSPPSPSLSLYSYE